jgi:hypothetical protein
MLRRIILLEPDFEQEESTTMALNRIFPRVHVVNFSVAGDLLIKYKEIVHSDIIITERRLPLFWPSEDSQKQISDVQAMFPKVSDWESNKGGEILIDCLREKGIVCPAIIYTSSWIRESLSSEGYVSDPQTVYCEKEESFDNLVLLIRSFASTLIQVRTHPCL